MFKNFKVKSNNTTVTNNHKRAMSSEVAQLAQARALAMDNKPEEMLPKVLETAMALYRSSPSPSVELGRLCARLFLDVMNHELVVGSEKPFLASQHLSDLSKLCRTSEDLSLIHIYCRL